MPLPGERVFTVSEITLQIKGALELQFAHAVVEGEISNFRPSGTGHWYFSLKDKDAVLQAVMFRNRIGTVRFIPADGQKVLARGSISVYALRGSYQLVCESLDPAGRGEILALLEERKRRLAEEGLFDRNRKRPLPKYPRRVAVVTSPTGAALRDILQVMKRRNAGIDVVILPTPVQGEGADDDIAAQILRASRHRLGEIIIVGRGGGSLEDLLPFSSEAVVRAIAASEVPVISAVGHETDVSLADLAADYRAPTPSAAAEVVSASREELSRRVYDLAARLHDDMRRRLERVNMSLALFSPENIERQLRVLVQPLLQRFDDAKEGVVRGMRQLVETSRGRLSLANGRLEACSPRLVLARGFSIVRKAGVVVRTSAELTPADRVRITFFEGEADAEIKKTGG